MEHDKMIRVPTETDLVVRGERRVFKTAFKTHKKKGVHYYHTVIMPSDLKLAGTNV